MSRRGRKGRSKPRTLDQGLEGGGGEGRWGAWADDASLSLEGVKVSASTGTERVRVQCVRGEDGMGWRGEASRVQSSDKQLLQVTGLGTRGGDREPLMYRQAPKP